MGFFRYIKNQIRHDTNMKRILAEEMYRLNRIEAMTEELAPRMRMEYLKDKTMHSAEPGVSGEQFCDKEVVVSLTSFGKRIYQAHLAIESIMQGTVKPNRIVLWLSEEEFKGKPLPRTIELQKDRGLQVEYCEDTRSYNKLVPSLKQYPNACIITIDDDAMYEYDIVERLLDAHRDTPDAVCACRVHKVVLDSNNKPLSYMDWEWCVENMGAYSSLCFPTGVGGVLYPPHCFSDEVTNQRVFMDICPKADDVWFYAMRLMSGTPAKQVYTGNPHGYYINLPSRWIGALSDENTNIASCGNDVQIKAVFEKYNLYEKLLERK